MISKLIFFLLLNFGALAIDGLSTGSGVTSEWYANLHKAPWTPPGWVFGFAWTTIMICYSVYMAQLWQQSDNKAELILLFSIQWILNVSWNPVFFSFHHTGMALVVIVALTFLIGYTFYLNWPVIKFKSVLLAPYFVWLLIATSLNAFIVIKN